MARSPSVKSTRLRRSGIRKTLAKASKNFMTGMFLLSRIRASNGKARPACLLLLQNVFGRLPVLPRLRTADKGRDQLDGTTRGFDLLARGLSDGMGRYRELAVHIAVAEDLETVGPDLVRDAHFDDSLGVEDIALHLRE